MKFFSILLIAIGINSFAYGQGFLFYKKNKIVEVPSTDTPFIRIFTTFTVDEKGTKKDFTIDKIECSLCNDSLIMIASKNAETTVSNLSIPLAK